VYYKYTFPIDLARYFYLQGQSHREHIGSSYLESQNDKKEIKNKIGTITDK
jgi:hypothetical protein